MQSEMEQNLKALQAKLPEDVALVAVGKTFPVEHIEQAYKLGLRDFGENKVQELYEKATALAHLTDIRWHFIGHLQTNKAKKLLAVPNLYMVHSVDREKVVKTLEKLLAQQTRKIQVLIQVNTSFEQSKYGHSPKGVIDFIETVASSSHLELKGLMTIGKLGGDEQQTKNCFAMLQDIRNQAENAGHPLEIMSMGMTSDFELAIAQGSNMVRVGQAIFGARAVPDSFYWPS